MNSCVELPFEIPMFITLQHYAAAGIALSSHPEGKNALLNYTTNLQCDRKFLEGYTSPMPECPGASLHTINQLIRHIVSTRYTFSIYPDIIRKMLDEGLYVYFGGVDDYYIPQKSWYGIRHMMHDGILLGYNDRAGTYKIAAYDMNWIFRSFEILQKDFDTALLEGLKDPLANCLLIGLGVKEGRIHLETNATPERLKIYLKNDIDEFPINKKNGKVNGIAVHNYFAKYMEFLHDGKIPHEKMDWRVMRLVWEFRNCMYQRLIAIETGLKLGNCCSNQYKEVLDRTNHLRILYALYHKKKKDSIPLLIRDELLALKGIEKEILTQFIHIKEDKVPV